MTQTTPTGSIRDGIHPTTSIPEVPWSTEARLASSIWFGMDASTRWAFIKRYGVEECAQLEFDFLRRHQTAHFLDGSRKLGLDGYPDHVRCAMYHTLSNLLGGLDMAFQDDHGDGKAWVFYLPPQAYATGPLLPTSAHGAVPIDIVLRTFEAWQANNGPLLGNDRLTFTLTDLIQAGGPYDAGYFSEAPGPVDPANRYVVDLGQPSGVPGPPPPLGAAQWPLARREAALRKYSAEYAVGGLAQIAQLKGLAVAAEIAEESHRNIVVAWSRYLASHFALSRTAPAPVRVAALFRRVFGLLGDEFESVGEGGQVLLAHTRTRLTVPQYQDWASLPSAVEAAFGRAWTVASRTIGPEVLVEVDQSRSAGEGPTVWRFTVAEA
ncbi:hypothetical protein [Amycolatopsis saalfeldensis]|uniref:Uncharacterized protein n=1 Tax=Amycolatopsis saalfeldensis TaxID=394193 RepID=A0A1H8XXH9_9PSEU|nr:hypothetical protein [Amycolatopsis saalfeldensis]SEP44750.1 hypothetical protein SAMN04489732_109294 [Amycolatopsis saalfeldensis]